MVNVNSQGVLKMLTKQYRDIVIASNENDDAVASAAVEIKTDESYSDRDMRMIAAVGLKAMAEFLRFMDYTKRATDAEKDKKGP